MTSATRLGFDLGLFGSYSSAPGADSCLATKAPIVCPGTDSRPFDPGISAIFSLLLQLYLSSRASASGVVPAAERSVHHTYAAFAPSSVHAKTLSTASNTNSVTPLASDAALGSSFLGTMTPVWGAQCAPIDMFQDLGRMYADRLVNMAVISF